MKLTHYIVIVAIAAVVVWASNNVKFVENVIG